MSNFSLNIAVTPLPSWRWGFTLLATGDNSALAIGGAIPGPDSNEILQKSYHKIMKMTLKLIDLSHFTFLFHTIKIQSFSEYFITKWHKIGAK